MTPEIAESMIEIMQLYVEGGNIQYRPKDLDFKTEWIDCENPTWNWSQFEYRIKPTPIYVPYTSANEVLCDIENKSRFLYNLKSAKTESYYLVRYIGNNIIKVFKYYSVQDDEEYTFEKAFEKFKWADGSVFGKLKD